MKERIKEIIGQIISENETKRNSRDYALLTEVKRNLVTEAGKILNEMYKSKEIIVGDTVNDKWIKLNKQN